MCWLYVPELEASSSDLSLPSLPPGAWLTSRGKRMPRRYWLRAWRRATWIRRLSGLTFEPSTVAHGVESWIASLLDSHVSRSLSQEDNAGSMTNGGSGRILHGSFATFDRGSSSWRTCQLSLLPDLLPCSVTWPRSGSLRSGAVSLRKPLVPPTGETDFSSLLPTPTAEGMDRGGRARARGDREGLERMARKGLLPTPTAHDSKDTGAPTEYLRRTPQLTAVVASGNQDRRLNPQFVEWMMGLPAGWTDCERAVTGLSHDKRQKP